MLMVLDLIKFMTANKYSDSYFFELLFLTQILFKWLMLSCSNPDKRITCHILFQFHHLHSCFDFDKVGSSSKKHTFSHLKIIHQSLPPKIRKDRV